MTQVHRALVPKDAETFIGPRGSEYFFRNGRKVYIKEEQPPRKPQVFKPRRGAFAKWLEKQQQI